MNKEFVSARLQFVAMDPETELKTSLSLSDLIEEAAAEDVNAIKTALQAVLDDPIETSTATVTYAFA
ncbi:hypothetical protein [Aerococcus urinaeequi]|uniref:hypothetical protein n=1 Tax=Aerococcus urinaeequi TaxID=51665 RepID=UPI000845F261|nr:hypothetical protein [Aerococcus urinaeequi]